MLDSGVLYVLGIGLVFVGIIVIILAIILISVSSAKKERSKEGDGKGEGRVRGGGVIMIGPVPIIFGTDKKSLKTAILLAIALVTLFIVAMVVYYLLLR